MLGRVEGGAALGVSIHAPTRGATFWPMMRVRWFWVFQSTRPRGARLPDAATRNALLEFQSTRPRGARRRRKNGKCCRIYVSIHAPTRGATGQHGEIGEIHIEVSIHAPTRGATGARPGDLTLSDRFNPRAHAGRDLHGGAVGADRAAVSIHAPTRGATNVASCKTTIRRCFNPRAHAGRDGAVGG